MRKRLIFHLPRESGRALSLTGARLPDLSREMQEANGREG